MDTTGYLIETARLRLRAMRPDDLDAIAVMFADPAVVAAFEEPPLTREASEGWLQRNLAHQAEHGYALFTIELRETGATIGDCGLTWMEIAGEPMLELGYDLQSPYWEQGLATEAAVAVRDYAFGTLGVPRLISLIRHTNHRSMRVAEKVGLRPDPTLDNAIPNHRIWTIPAPESG